MVAAAVGVVALVTAVGVEALDVGVGVTVVGGVVEAEVVLVIVVAEGAEEVSGTSLYILCLYLCILFKIS